MIKKGRKHGSAKVGRNLSIALSQDLYDRVEIYCDNNEIKSFSQFFRDAAERFLTVLTVSTMNVKNFQTGDDELWTVTESVDGIDIKKE